MLAERSGSGTIDVGDTLRNSEVGSVLERLDRELVTLEPDKTRIREIAALLSSEPFTIATRAAIARRSSS